MNADTEYQTITELLPTLSGVYAPNFALLADADTADEISGVVNTWAAVLHEYERAVITLVAAAKDVEDKTGERVPVKLLGVAKRVLDVIDDMPRLALHDAARRADQLGLDPIEVIEHACRNFTYGCESCDGGSLAQRIHGLADQVAIVGIALASGMEIPK